MPIHTPGEKFRYHRILSKKGGKREVVALLSLTAMVDMFTVLVIFLLQNFDPKTNAVLYIPKEVTLPKAAQIKELKPAVVVTISHKEVLLDKTPIISFEALKAQEDWMIQPLHTQLVSALQKSKTEFDKKLSQALKKVVDSSEKEDPNAWNKVTIQADKGVDFLTVKKVMYTVTEAGAGEINFAVNKERSQQ